jgi:hypothetical protein
MDKEAAILIALEQLEGVAMVDLAPIYGRTEWYGPCGNVKDNTRERYRIAALVRRCWKNMGRTERLQVWWDDTAQAPYVLIQTQDL